MCPRPVIDILKIDIEGGESTLFGEEAESWLKCVRPLCVEIHGTEAELIIERALRSFRFERLQCGEYNLYLNLHPKAAQRIEKDRQCEPALVACARTRI